jgi:circadian clock protein KaiC
MERDRHTVFAYSPGSPLEKAPTYIRGIDEILEGGLPRGRTTVLLGEAGSGKTVFGLEFLYRGALDGEPGIFVGFEESAAQLRQNAATLGWDLAALENSRGLVLVEGVSPVETILSGEFSLKGLLAVLSGISRETGARRVVLDALEVVLRLFGESVQARSELYALNHWLHGAGLTSIMTVRPARRRQTAPLEDFFESMGDCLIRLDTRTEAQVSTRRLQVVKYRGSAFGRNHYPYAIIEGGLWAAPVSAVALRRKVFGGRMPSGVEGLDEMLGGGFHQASCVLIAGEPGTGKSLLLASFIRSACERGEKVLYINFEESEEAVVSNVTSAGIDLRPAVAAGRLHFLTSFPEATGAEEHLIKALERIESLEPDHLVVDAISACPRMGGNQAAFDYLVRLLNTCYQRGMTAFFTNQIAGHGRTEISGNGISSLVDTVVRLSYQEESWETNRLLQVIKSRGSRHSNQKREFTITERGIRIGRPFGKPGQGPDWHGAADRGSETSG